MTYSRVVTGVLSLFLIAMKFSRCGMHGANMSLIDNEMANLS